MTFSMHTLLKTAVVSTLITLLLSGCNQNTAAHQINTKDVASDANKTEQTSALNNTPATNNNPNHQSDVALALQNNLNKSGIDAKVQSVIPTDIPEMYLATLDKVSPVFVDKTGTYVIQGTIMQIGDVKPIDISGLMMSKVAISELRAVDKSEMIIFPAKGETKAFIYVFSDPTCHYCQLLHKEIEQTNNAGIEVRYLAWPRGEELIDLTERVWCSTDRHAAITEAKQGGNVNAPSCDNPVRKHMALGHKLGISGTPAIFAENGKQLGGYLPSPELVEQAIINKQ